MGCAKFGLAVSRYNAMVFKPIKRLLYTWFDNCSVLFGLSELLGHKYAV